MKIRSLLIKAGKAILPHGIFIILRNARDVKKSYGNNPKSYCPICQKTGFFLPNGVPRRPKVKCPHCGSGERQRLMWLFLQKYTDIFNKVPKRILHVAAESCIRNRIGKLYGKEYITADLNNPNAMVKMDIMDIHYPSETFDIIICSHVLEHVAEDIKAMKEIHRVLKNDGWAILLVPIADIDKTYEDSSITDEGGRFWAFGQNDHVRKYGKDYEDRLKSAGFNVKTTGANELADNDGIEKMRLKEETKTWGFMETKIYFCTK